MVSPQIAARSRSRLRHPGPAGDLEREPDIQSTAGERDGEEVAGAVQAGEDANLIEDGWAYFANSYRATAAPGWTVAWATHGGRYVAAMERGNVVTCQFHPELSGAYGEALLSRFLELA